MKLEVKPYLNTDRLLIEDDYYRGIIRNTQAERAEAVVHHAARKQAAENALEQGLFDAEVMMRIPQRRLEKLIEYTAKCLMPPDKAWRIARSTWLELDEVYQYRNDWEQFFNLFMPYRDDFMIKRELDHLSQLPDEIKIYRGYDRALGRSGLSWTMSKLIASQYANRFKSLKIAQGMVKKEDVVGYIVMRGHYEIVLRSEFAVLNQRAVNTVRPDEAMRWVIENKGELL